MDRTFLLGVGAQKAGTTWLYGTLAAMAQVNLGVRKEYHIWDALSSDLFKGNIVTQGMIHAGEPDAAIRYRMQNEPNYYARYFNELFNGGISLTGDITPSYSSLSAEDWNCVRRHLQPIDARIRVVFLMRDPFERCWSAVRMKKRLSGLTASDEELLVELHSTPQFEARTRYDRTVSSLRASFSERELYFGLYETMYEANEIQRLSNFLGLSFPASASDHQYNVSPKLEHVSGETVGLVRDFYREVYDFCFAEFPTCRSCWGNLPVADRMNL